MTTDRHRNTFTDADANQSCNPEGAEIPFENILDRVTASGSGWRSAHLQSWQLSAAKPALGRMCDQEAIAALLIDLEFRVCFQKRLNRRQRPRSGCGKERERVDDAVLHHEKAPRSDEAMVSFHLAQDMCLVMV